MKRLGIAILLFLCCQIVFAPAHPAASQADVWTPGLYMGWVYFLARSDYDYNVSESGIKVTDTTTLYHEAHGEIECTVRDEAGNGACSGKFPMEKIAGRYGTLTSPDCNATWRESIRASATSGLVPLAPLTDSPLAGGFSIPFTPESGQAYADLVVEASGNPACQSQAISAKTNVGIPKWPDLDFKIGNHTVLTAEGTCNMQTFPRQMTVGHAVTTAVIEQCEWHLFYFDPYAKLP
jgi:hypothetical protein